jgi:dephospho-CoA kinase
MKPVGLTGPMGGGKSTVLSLLEKYPRVLGINSDCLAKEFLSSEECREDVVNILGSQVIESQVMNFKAVAEIIFVDAEKKKQIEALIHPLVWKAIEEKIRQAGEHIIPIVESAILYESKWQHRFACMIVATCNEKEQFRRLKVNRNMDDKAIRARIAQQLPQKEKERRADIVIHTDCTMRELEKRVDILYQQLTEWKGAQP